MDTKRKSLYKRLGGVYAIAAVIDRFSDALIENPIVGKNSKNPALRRWSRKSMTRLSGLKWMRTLWVCHVSGGPYKFIATRKGKCPLSLENAHRRFHITSEEFDEVARILKQTLIEFRIQKQERSEVLKAFGSHKDEVAKSLSPVSCPFSSKKNVKGR